MRQETRRHSAKDRRQQIMQAALKLFASKGFRGTTTKNIAEKARVNEAIIFRHFPRKEDLYWAVIEDKCHSHRKGSELETQLHSNTGPRKIFTALAEDTLRRQTEDTTLSRLLLFSALENHRLSHRFFRTYVAEYYEKLADYIRGHIREGVFRSVDPRLAARGFIGMVIYHFLIQELFGGKRYQKYDQTQVSSVLTDIWLKGMLAERGHRSRGDRPAGRK